MTTLQTRLEENIKQQADTLFQAMGISTTDAVRLFIRQCLVEGGLPFRPSTRIPNAETLAALEDTTETKYENVEALAKLWK